MEKFDPNKNQYWQTQCKIDSFESIQNQKERLKEELWSLLCGIIPMEYRHYVSERFEEIEDNILVYKCFYKSIKGV